MASMMNIASGVPLMAMKSGWVTGGLNLQILIWLHSFLASPSLSDQLLLLENPLLSTSESGVNGIHPEFY